MALRDLLDAIMKVRLANPEAELAAVLLVKGANGSAAAPSVSFANDPDTGMYRSAADSLGWTVGGTLEAGLDSSGFSIFNGDGLRCYDPDNDDFIRLFAGSGANAFLAPGAAPGDGITDIQFTLNLEMMNGTRIDIVDATNADIARLRHDGTSLLLENAAGTTIFDVGIRETRFRGTTNNTHINYLGDASEDTYIRGGLATSRVMLGDVNTGAGGRVQVGTQFAIPDGIAAPTAVGGLAFLFVDSADGDLKVRFADGVTKTLATDT